MKIQLRKSLISGILLLCISVPSSSLAQESETSEPKKETRHQLGFVLSHTQLRSEEATTGSGLYTVTSETFFYNYHISEKWFVGLHTDITNEQFEAVIQTDDRDIDSIVRKRPIAPALMLGYKPSEHWSLMLGGGADIDEDESLGLIRLDVEYSAELPRDWEFLISVGFDFRVDAYSTLSYGLGVGKNF